ncbi:DNA starvation/stationary phase protection protein [Clostridium sp. YIM B02505]|uniref:DNA starvation/stationary phase protection protein n=1 Tax=Clostridium yunnanense TaxID=2800325 RepID=A0ABS1ENH8_9CLOT|nr:Dps family protein [Clostridium yunnanense]MBK1810924.1 DNA starvation/stationary phase protection protein [Clostridium yunnanense]
MGKNYIGLEKDGLETIVRELNKYLANLNIIYTKLHNLHWNIKGAAFFELHTKFEEYYDKINIDLDAVAERILTLGHTPAASLKEYLSLSTIAERESKDVTPEDSIEVIRKDFSLLLEASRNILTIADDANDQGTVDLMAGFISKYEKDLWMLTAFTKK